MSDIEVIDTPDGPTLARFDAVIDVRSPSEFAEDHVPGAINLPVLDDAERAEVGTIYVQDSRFKARRRGAALVARNVARHLETALADKPGAFKPLVYCWRGGQRSGAMATILSQVGWRTAVLAGGYRTYRRRVQQALYEETRALDLVLIDGRTGSAKTEILGRLAALGLQTLDLEGLAAHRGSLLGALPGRPQPSQKMFESRLLQALDGLDPTRPILVEAESSKIGERMIPPMLWRPMTEAPRITLQVPPEHRARYLARVYADSVQDLDALEALLHRLPGRHGRKAVAAWRALAEAGEFEALAGALIEAHYDPAYDRSSRIETRRSLGVIEVPGLAEADQDAAAKAIEARLESHQDRRSSPSDGA
jgi:tRNA 2-selenouridine synthase